MLLAANGRFFQQCCETICHFFFVYTDRKKTESCCTRNDSPIRLRCRVASPLRINTLLSRALGETIRRQPIAIVNTTGINQHNSIPKTSLIAPLPARLSLRTNSVVAARIVSSVVVVTRLIGWPFRRIVRRIRVAAGGKRPKPRKLKRSK